MASKSYIAVELQNILAAFSQEVQDEYESELDRITKEAVKKLKATSPKDTASRRHYANGWTVKSESRRQVKTFIVYNKTKPGLAHLLEYGHAKVNGGRVEPSPEGGHIKPVETWAIQEAEHAAEIAVQRARG